MIAAGARLALINVVWFIVQVFCWGSTLLIFTVSLMYTKVWEETNMVPGKWLYGTVYHQYWMLMAMAVGLALIGVAWASTFIKDARVRGLSIAESYDEFTDDVDADRADEIRDLEHRLRRLRGR